jgi:hypothetical protein
MQTLSNPTDRSHLVESLSGLMERLSAPDLTAAEANDLRPRLLGLLHRIDAPLSVPHTPGPRLGANRA